MCIKGGLCLIKIAQKKRLKVKKKKNQNINGLYGILTLLLSCNFDIFTISTVGMCIS